MQSERRKTTNNGNKIRMSTNKGTDYYKSIGSGELILPRSRESVDMVRTFERENKQKFSSQDMEGNSR